MTNKPTAAGSEEPKPVVSKSGDKQWDTDTHEMARNIALYVSDAHKRGEFPAGDARKLHYFMCAALTTPFPFKLAAPVPVERTQDEPTAAESEEPKSQGLCDTTMTERFENKDCVCPTYPANLGPCAKFEEGGNARCVFCDHELSCHLAVGKRKFEAVMASPAPTAAGSEELKPIQTECCKRLIAGDERYCPRCGWECRIEWAAPVASQAPAPKVCVDCRDYEENIRGWIEKLGGDAAASHISIELEQQLSAALSRLSQLEKENHELGAGQIELAALLCEEQRVHQLAQRALGTLLNMHDCTCMNPEDCEHAKASSLLPSPPKEALERAGVGSEASDIDPESPILP